MLMPTTKNQMKVSAARMAAEGEDPELNGFKQANQAPVTPTTNAQVSQKKASPQMVKPMNTAGGPPGFGGTIGGNLTNGGQQALPQGVQGPQSAQGRSNTQANNAVVTSSAPQTQVPNFVQNQNAKAQEILAAKTAANSGDLTSGREGQIDGAVDGLLNGNYDTTAENQLLNDMMQDQAARGQLDLEAKLGASGFGVSGAAAAGISNLRTKAARDAAAQMFALDEQRRQDKRSDLQLGFSQNNFERQDSRAEQDYNDKHHAALTANGQIIDDDGDSHDDSTGLTQDQTEALAIREADYKGSTAWYGPSGSEGNPYVIERSQFGQAQADLKLQPTNDPSIYRAKDGTYYRVR